MSATNKGGIMSKARTFLTNGNIKTVFQFGALIFAAGILWAKVSGVELQLADLTDRVDMVVRHLLGTSP